MKTSAILFLFWAAATAVAQDQPAADDPPAVAMPQAGVSGTPPVPVETPAEVDSPPVEMSALAREGQPATPGADDPPEEIAGENIPKAHPDSRYQAAWSKNPFMLKTVAVAQATVSFAQDWALAGMYKSTTGKITVTLQNKQTQEYQRVTNEDTEGEFRLVEAKFNRNRNEASVIIAKGSQSAEIKYDDSLISKPVTINNTLRPPANAAGQPGAQQPGMPGAPGVPVSATGGVGGVPRPGVTVPGTTRTLVPGAVGAPGAASAVTPPSISRRRQLIPPPTVAPPPQP